MAKEDAGIQEWVELLEETECIGGECYGVDITDLPPENMVALLMAQLRELKVEGYSLSQVAKLVEKYYKPKNREEGNGNGEG